MMAEYEDIKIKGEESICSTAEADLIRNLSFRASIFGGTAEIILLKVAEKYSTLREKVFWK